MSDHGPVHTDTHAAHGSDGSHGIGKYVFVFLALCVLTGASFMTYTEVWRENMPISVGRSFMMAVSCTKALLVILFFMHVKYEANWKYVLTIPPGLMSIFLMLALVPDVGLRQRMVSEERKLHQAIPHPYTQEVDLPAAPSGGH